jgi:hypothetical protein
MQICSCLCMPAFRGAVCETIMCDKQPIECNSFPASQCTSNSFKFYCPVVCGQCLTTTTISSTTLTSELKPVTTSSVSCGVILPCMNGGTYNSTSCSCNCNPA